MPRDDAIQIRGGTAAAWAAANPLLFDREPGYETDTHRWKVGDGVNLWASLEYANQADLLNLVNSIAGKAPISVVADLASLASVVAVQQVAIGLKAPISSVSDLAADVAADLATLASDISAKPDQSDVDAKADQTDLNALTTTVAGKLPKAGGTMTGPLTLSGDPSSNNHAATKAYVDANAAGNPLIFVPRLPTEFYGDRYGVVPGECTAAVNAVIDEIASESGELIFMEPQRYLFNGPLLTTLGRNAQVLLPVSGGAVRSIGFRGCIPPMVAASFTSPVDLPKATILKSTLSTVTGTNPAFIGGNGSIGGRLSIADLVVELPTAPSFTGINLNIQGNVTLKDLIVVGGSKMGDVSQFANPTVTTAYGIKLPPTSSAILLDLLGQVSVFGFHTGMLGGEMMNANFLSFWFCKYALELPASVDDMFIQRMLVGSCTVGVWVTGVCPFRIMSMVTERAGAGHWYSTLYDLADGNHWGSGEIEWQTTIQGVGRTSIFTKNGGNGVTCKERGTVLA